MGRRKRRDALNRKYKLIGFKAFTDADADLIAWWESVPAGERSSALRDLLRMALGYMSPPSPPAESRLIQMQSDVLWLRDALNDLPAYMEHIIQDVAAHTANHTLAQIEAHAAVKQDPRPTNGHHNGASIAEEDARRREERMKRKKW